MSVELPEAGREQLDHAEALLQEGKCGECIEQAQDARDLFIDAGDLVGEAEALRLEILAKQDEGDVDDAAKPPEIDLLCDIELARFRRCNCRKAEAILLYTLVECNMTRSQQLRKDLFQHGLEARRIFRELGEKWWEGRAVLMLVNVLSRSGEAIKMHEYANEAFAIFQETQDRKRQGMALHASCLAYLAEKQPAAAVEKGREALALYRDIGDRRLEIAELKTIAMWRMNLEGNNGMIAAREAVEALELSRKYPKTNQEASVLHVALQALMHVGDRKEALRQAGISLKRFETDPKKSTELVTLRLLTDMLQGKECGMDQDAVNGIQSKSHRLDVLCDLARTLMQRGELQRAHGAATQGIDLAKELGRSCTEAQARRTLAHIYFQAGEDAEATHQVKEAKRISQECGDNEGVGASWSLEATFFFEAGHLEKAQLCLREAQEIFEACGRYEKEADVWNLSAEFHLSTKSLQAALQASAKRLEVVQRHNGKVQEQVSAIDMLVNVYLAQQNLQEAEKAAAEMLRLARLNQSQIELEIRAHIQMAQVSLLAVQLEGGPDVSKSRNKPLQSAEKAWALAMRDAAGKDSKANAKYVLAEGFACVGRCQQALLAAQEAEGYYVSPALNDLCGASRSLCLQASLVAVTGQAEEAKQLAEKALQIAKDAGYQDGVEVAELELQRLKSGVYARGSAAGKGRSSTSQATERSHIEAAPAPSSSSSPGLDPQAVKAKLMASVQSVLADDEVIVDSESALLDIGMDSLSAIDLQNLIAKDFPFANPSSTVLFDFPTVRELTAHIVDASKQAGL
eukprot:TRINITY_DN6431_c0_g1_i1.p1 TRINITY_DN6431_c0_g1~~TRINITY_DN6431_c0_g1_i1.p1  ORF type:complete len:800 (-),score=221.96 TRINITY_DN6431_c0_g1_i1:457-2856(-)